MLANRTGDGARTRKRGGWIAALCAAAAICAAPATAGALTLGSTSFPFAAPTSHPESCTGASAFFYQAATDASLPSYVVPAGGGVIDSWSVNTFTASASHYVDLLVLRPKSGGGFDVVAVDEEQLPAVIPLVTDNVATFPLSTPIPVQPGDTIARTGDAFTTLCASSDASLIPAGDAVDIGATPAQKPAVGTHLTPNNLPAQSRIVNVSADLVQPAADLGVTQSVTPTTVFPGMLAQLAFTVANAGPGTAPATFSATLPAGLTPLAGFSPAGSCAPAGQAVSCALGSLGPGSAATVDVYALPGGPGFFQTVGTAGGPLIDPNPGNNSAVASLSAVPVPIPGLAPSTPSTAATLAPACRVPPLAGAPVALAKRILAALSCRVGRVTRSSSKTFPNGDVIKTSPGQNAVAAAGTTVSIVSSSGKPKPAKHKRKR